MGLNNDILEANILIVDDEIANVKLLERVLQIKGYQNIQSTTDPSKVENLCKVTEFDVFLLDIRMPKIDGFELMEMLTKHFNDDYIPVLVLTAQTDEETHLKALEYGAKDFITKPFNTAEVLNRIYNLLEVRLMHKQVKQQNLILEGKVKRRTEELYHTRQQVIRKLGLAAEYRDNETGNHIIRMSKYSYLLALAYGLSESEADMILNASPMHDIGKIGIPDNVLLKPGKLDANEWKTMQSHVIIGGGILADEDSKLMNTAQQIALHHHEKWDGSGYPKGLKEDEISIEGRLCAVADVFDALLSKRPYKEPWPVEKAIDLIESEAGKHFDPKIAPLMTQILPDIQTIMADHPDEK